MDKKISKQCDKERKCDKADKGNEKVKGNNEGGNPSGKDCILDKLLSNWENANSKTNKWNSTNDRDRNDSINNKSYNKGENNNGWNNTDYRNTNGHMRKGEYSGKQREPCFNYFHNVCRFGKHCRYAHPEICESWSEIGKCRGVNGSCEKPHPMICRSYNEHVYCNRRNCKFMHPRQRQMENPRAQQGASSRDQSRKFENDRHNNGRHNNNHNHNHNPSTNSKQQQQQQRQQQKQQQ